MSDDHNFEKTMKRIPRVATLHDITGVGRCALSVVMPIVSAMGVQCCPAPTAVLSNHPAGFDGYTFTPLTGPLEDTFLQWGKLGLAFDAVYSGFLAGPEQVKAVKGFMAAQKENGALIFVDPAMGDHGKLYRFFPDTMPAAMRELITTADVITPNYTEACLLLGKKADAAPVSEEQAQALAMELLTLGAGAAVITSVPIKDGQLATVCANKNGVWLDVYQPTPVQFPGSGDLFASVMVTALVQGKSLKESMLAAGAFASKAVQVTYKAGTPPREGLLIEALLRELTE